MADSAQEKTEQATPRKLEEAANKGQFAYSKEMVQAVALLATVSCLRFIGGDLSQKLQSIFGETFSLEWHHHVTLEGIQGLMQHVLRLTLDCILPFLLLVFAVVALAGFLQIGFSISLERIQWNWSKLDPLAGFKRLVSMRSVVAVVLSLLKLMVVGLVAWSVIDDLAMKAGNLASADDNAFLHLLPEALFTIGFRVGIFIFLLAVADFFWQRWRFSKDMMMTKEEVKEDARKGEGDPQVKARIRRVQREMARARMFQDVKKATVVVRNPTHYAVALRYEKGQDSAPRMVAKGKNLVALRIIQIAEEAGVPVRSDPPLARQIHAMVKVGQTIPEELYRAVAQVLAWVYKQRGRRAEA